jgi:hypothetical protein
MMHGEGSTAGTRRSYIGEAGAEVATGYTPEIQSPVRGGSLVCLAVSGASRALREYICVSLGPQGLL